MSVMKSGILNKRKRWLQKQEADFLDVWSKDADELQGFKGTLKYFGIRQVGKDFEINHSIEKTCFQQSLALFKLVLQKQIYKKDIDLPGLEPLPDYDALITIVGFSPEPLMHTVLTLAPNKVYPVATEESARYFFLVPLSSKTQKPDGTNGYFEAIIERYKEPQHQIIIEPIGRNVASIGSLDTFRRVREIIKEVRSGNRIAKIAIDITGGKKSADVSAFLIAAIEEKIDIYYVDFEDYNVTKACCGTEFLNKLDNPYSIYNIHEESLIKTLWERQDFDAVTEIAGQAIEKLTEAKAEKYGLEKELNRLIQIKSAAQCYSEWSRFNYLKALDGVFDYYKRKHDDILSRLKDCKNIRKDAYGVILLAIDRWTRGVDAISVAGYDKAALCFTQAIESLCAFRLISLVIDEKVVSSNKNNFNPDKEWITIKSLIKFLLGYGGVDSIQSKQKKGIKGSVSQTYKWSLHEKDIMNYNYCLIEELLDFRNEMAHFECYDEAGNAVNKACCESFMNNIKDFIILFINTYQNEEQLKEKTFDILQAPFNFARYSDFD